MKCISVRKCAIAVVAVALWLGGTTNSSAAFAFELGSILSGDTPGNSPPWLRATLTQDGNDVLLQMEAINLAASPPNFEFVGNWAFNLNAAYNISELTATEEARSGSFVGAVTYQSPPSLGYAGFDFDFGFNFPNDAGGDPAANRFTDGDSITFRLSRGGADPVNVADFIALTPEHGGQQYYSGAHIQSIGSSGNGSAFVGADTVVPEPATMVAGVLLLIPLGLGTLRRIMKGNERVTQ